jgi:hypothetical protein
MAINVNVTGGTGIDAAPSTEVVVNGGIGPAAYVNSAGEIVGTIPFEAGTGITITTASGSITISGLSNADISGLAPVQDVNGYIGNVTLTVQDITAAAAVHTHTTSEITGLNDAIAAIGNVTSVNTQTGEVTLTVQDITAAAAVHNHTRSEVTDLTSSDISFSPYRVLFSNVYQTIGDLPAAADHHGAFVHVHAEGRAYFAHAGNWIALSNQGDTPENIVANISDLADVNLSGLTAGQHLEYNGTAWTPVTPASTEPTTPPTDLTMIQTSEGLQTFLWNGDAESGFEVELIELTDTVIDIEDNSTIATESDGSITLVAELDATYLDGVVISATNDFVDWEQAFYEQAVASSSNITVTGVYLPEEFNAPGNYTLALTLLDLDDQVSADTGPTMNVTVASHGSPVAPAIETARWTGGNLSVGVTAITNAHMNGFYSLDEITYYLETSEDQDAGPWARSSGLPANSTGTTEFSVQGLNISAPLWGRIVAVNPLGEGVPTRVREL